MVVQQTRVIPMALDNIGLNRLMGILPKPLGRRIAIVRADAKKTVLKERRLATGDGPDFYGPFWGDAKQFFFENFDLVGATKDRIRRNRSRRRLYPLLLEQFLGWHKTVPCSKRERERIEGAFGTSAAATEKGKVLVQGLLGWTDPTGRPYLVYPYFSQDLPLGRRVARLGRWIMADALPTYDASSLEILDVLHGRTFDNDNCPLVGGEGETVSGRYTQLLTEWEAQKRLLRGS